jgi:hypothetical protein
MDRLRPPSGRPVPPAPSSPPANGAFVFFPGPLAPWQLALYQWAFAQAKEVVRPSLPERDLLAVWN